MLLFCCFVPVVPIPECGWPSSSLSEQMARESADSLSFLYEGHDRKHRPWYRPSVFSFLVKYGLGRMQLPSKKTRPDSALLNNGFLALLNNGFLLL